MPRTSPPRPFVTLVVRRRLPRPTGSFPSLLGAACIAIGGLAASAVEPEPAAKKPDWAGLDALLRAGDYEKAAAAADELTSAEKPKPRDPDFGLRSGELARALMRRGLAELRLGRYDAADATLLESFRVLKNPDFTRVLAAEARRATPQVMGTLVGLDISLVELLDLRAAVILERLRAVGLDRPAAGDMSAEQEAELRERVGGWLDDLDGLEKSATRARKELAERMEKGGDAILASPHNRALVGRFRPAIGAGIRALALGRLPCGDPRSTTGDPAKPADGAARERFDEALRHFQDAATALDEAIAAAAPKGVGSMKPEARMEADLMRAEVLAWEGMALLETHEPTQARERFAKVMELQQEATVLRRIPKPEMHPDLFAPLLLTAEAMLDEARAELDAGDSARSRAGVLEASKILARADGLPFPREHPLRGRLASLQARATGDLSAVRATIPGADAADTAARRIRRAIDGAAPSAIPAP